jgi:hypothetical protein
MCFTPIYIGVSICKKTKKANSSAFCIPISLFSMATFFQKNKRGNVFKKKEYDVNAIYKLL